MSWNELSDCTYVAEEELVEIGTHCVLELIKIFDGAFGGTKYKYGNE
jgi:hypothetical protein